MRRATASLLLAASACWVPVERGQQMEARIVRLEEENALSARQLEEQRAVIRERIAKVDEKIAEVQGKLDELNATAHRTGADLSVSQDRLQDQVARLRGQAEVAQHGLDELQQAFAALKTDVDGRFAALKGAGALQEWDAQKKAAALPRPPDRAGLLALAQKQEQAGEPHVARVLYEELVRKWPSDPRAADAWFRIGEIQYGDRRYRDAILAYGKVAQDFPRSDKAPDAVYRTAEAMLALDLKQDARSILEDLVARHPKTEAARKARARLREMSAPARKKAGKK